MAPAAEEIAPEAAERLLEPIFRVLCATGLSEAAILRIAAHLLERSSSRRPRSIRLIPHDARLETVISRWYGGVGYSQHGEPAPLRISGKHPSFASLVRGVSTALSPQRALRDLVTLRVVRRAGKRVILVRKFVPFASTRGVNLTAATVVAADFLRAWEAGLLGRLKPGKGLFLRAAHNLVVGRSSVAAFDAFARHQGQLLLESVDHWLTGRADRPRRARTRSRNKARLGLGIYVINDGLQVK